MILYFVGSLLTPQSFQSYSLEIVSYSLFSWFWGCFGLKELYHHQTDSDEVRRHADAQWAGCGLKARKGIYFMTGCKCCCCEFCVCDCRISDIFRYTQAAVFFSLQSSRSVRSLLLITSTKHRAFIQFDCLSAGVWWRVSHQEEVEQQLPTNNDFHDWLICWWLSWLQLMVQSWSGQAKLLFCSSVRHTVCVTSW